jgi:hypothetical protein
VLAGVCANDQFIGISPAVAVAIARLHAGGTIRAQLGEAAEDDKSAQGKAREQEDATTIRMGADRGQDETAFCEGYHIGAAVSTRQLGPAKRSAGASLRVPLTPVSIFDLPHNSRRMK